MLRAWGSANAHLYPRSLPMLISTGKYSLRSAQHSPTPHTPGSSHPLCIVEVKLIGSATCYRPILPWSEILCSDTDVTNKRDLPRETEAGKSQFMTSSHSHLRLGTSAHSGISHTPFFVLIANPSPMSNLLLLLISLPLLLPISSSLAKICNPLKCVSFPF